MLISAPDLNRACNAILSAFGCRAGEAAVVADHLVMANLSGHDSHGVGILPTYATMVKAGTLVPNQQPETIAAHGAVRVVDARGGFGQRMALIALDDAVRTVETHRACVLALRNSGHLGRIGAYSEYCAERGFASLHFVDVYGAGPLVAPYGGREKRFSTNPVSIGVPGDENAFPFLDMATSTVALGKVRVANNSGLPASPGALIDEEGRATRDPRPIVERQEGALTAFGGHKGSGLAVFTEILAGALAGTHMVGPQLAERHGPINNMLSIVIDPAAFDDPAAIRARTADFCAYVKASAPAGGFDEVLLPGDPERRAREERGRVGIDLDDNTIAQLVATGEAFGLSRSDVAVWERAQA